MEPLKLLRLDEVKNLISKRSVNKECLLGILYMVDIEFYNYDRGHYGFTFFSSIEDKFITHINSTKPEREQKLTLIHELIHIFYGIASERLQLEHEEIEKLIDDETLKLYQNETRFVDELFRKYRYQSSI